MLVPLLKIVVCFWIPDNIVSTVKLFVDDISIFSAVNEANISPDGVNKDPQKISKWFYRWKMSFNPDLIIDFFQKTRQIKSPKNLF